MKAGRAKVEITGRLLAIDGLRGLAALAVVLFHLSGHIKKELTATVPQWMMTIFEYGFLGVPVFFVLSGFVIAASVKSSAVTINYVGRFALRRSIRLDIVYWSAIGLALLMLWLKGGIMGHEINYPPLSEVALHAFYLQDLFNVKNQISAVFWTLCLEVQFYLFFILSIYATSRISPIYSSFMHSVIVAILAIISSMAYVGTIAISVPGFFLKYWIFFSLGCLCYRSLKFGGVHALLFSTVIVASLAVIVGSGRHSYILAATATVLFIYVLGIYGLLKRGLSSQYPQFLGMVSYSLYLTHPEIGWKSISVFTSIIPMKGNTYGAPLVLTLGVVISIIFSYFFYKLIEKPSHALSKRIALNQSQQPVTADSVVPVAQPMHYVNGSAKERD